MINGSWSDAQAYASWLKEETGKDDRLPSETEWEHAARAGTTTRYSWDDAITSENANFDLNAGKTTEVGCFPADPWGQRNMHDDVWVEDCRNDNFNGAPQDGVLGSAEIARAA